MSDQFDKLSLEERIEMLLDPEHMTNITTDEDMVAFVNMAMDLLAEAIEELRKSYPKDSG